MPGSWPSTCRRCLWTGRSGSAGNAAASNADANRGKALFDAKGCIACHQVHGKGGDVGPSLTTQVPEFPQGTWVGDKLKGEWIYQWLKDPQSLVPGHAGAEPGVQRSGGPRFDRVPVESEEP